MKARAIMLLVTKELLLPPPTRMPFFEVLTCMKKRITSMMRTAMKKTMIRNKSVYPTAGPSCTGRPRFDRKPALPDTDAIITDESTSAANTSNSLNVPAVKTLLPFLIDPPVLTVEARYRQEAKQRNDI